VLVHLKAILKRKLIGKFPKVVLILRVNVPARRPLAMQKNLAYLCFQYLDHPNYSPDLAPSDYHLFPGLKKQLNFSHFSSQA
jgi:histone-lysine N-methyltransferase SETMAR